MINVPYGRDQQNGVVIKVRMELWLCQPPPTIRTRSVHLFKFYWLSNLKYCPSTICRKIVLCQENVRGKQVVQIFISSVSLGTCTTKLSFDQLPWPVMLPFIQALHMRISCNQCGNGLTNPLPLKFASRLIFH